MRKTHEATDKASLLAVGNINRLMTTKRITNRELQYRTGIDNSDISRLRNLQRTPTLLTIAKIAEGLEVNITDLVAGAGE